MFTVGAVIEMLFPILSEVLFDGSLPTPDFHVVSSCNLSGVETMGCYSGPDKGPNFGRHDIFFNPRMHQGVIEGRWMTATVETLLHEMVHFWCYMQHIDDGDGIYHNEAFRDAAMAHGLDCRHQDSLGWQLTVVRPSTWFRLMMVDPVFEMRLRIEGVMGLRPC